MTIYILVKYFIKKYSLSWEYGPKNSYLVVNKCVGCTSVEEILSDVENIVETNNFEGFLHDSNIECNKINVESLNYETFVLSAIVNKILIGLQYTELSDTIRNISYYLINDTILSDKIYELIKTTGLFHHYTTEVLIGLKEFFSNNVNNSCFAVLRIKLRGF